MTLGIVTRLTCRLAFLAAMLVPATTPAIAEVSTEPQLKAAYLINFLKYVEWPVTSATITLCLFGRNSLGPYLAIHEGRQIGGRELRIRKVSNAEQLLDCQELFIPDTEAAHFASIRRWADKQPILTVSDAEIFPREGGAIALVRSDGGLRFDVNAANLEHAGLRVSPLMIRLARQVIGAPR